MAVDPETLNADLLTLILRASVILGVIVYIPSVYFLYLQGLFSVILVDTIAISFVIALLVLKRLPYRFRASVTCLIYYAVGALITINFTMLNMLLTLAVGRVLKAVNSALRKEISNRTAFERERTLLRTLIDALPDVVFTKDTEGRFVNCNSAALALFGVEREEQAAGKTVFDLFASPALAEAYDTDDRSVMAGETLINKEERSVGADGHPIWYLIIKVPLRDTGGETIGLIGIIRDITARKQAEAERDRVLAQLQLQVERLPLGYLLADRDLRYTRWNPAAERIFGFKQSEVLGKHPFDVIVPVASQAFVGSIFDKLRAGAMDAHGESENRTKEGGSIMCEWFNTPLFDDAGHFTGLLSLARDVTYRRKLEGQLRQSQKMDAIGQLAGGIAHDFNNLLSVILSYSDILLAESSVGDLVHADVDEIRRAGLRAAELTRQLLMFSRQQVVEPRVLDLNQVLTSVDKMLHRLVGEDLEVTSILGESLGLVRADQKSARRPRHENERVSRAKMSRT